MPDGLGGQPVRIIGAGMPLPQMFVPAVGVVYNVWWIGVGALVGWCWYLTRNELRYYEPNLRSICFSPLILCALASLRLCVKLKHRSGDGCCDTGAVGNSAYQYGIRSMPITLKKVETAAISLSYYSQHNRPRCIHIPLFWGRTLKSGKLCEFFHKKRLDRYLNVLYYRASLTLMRGNRVNFSPFSLPA